MDEKKAQIDRGEFSFVLVRPCRLSTASFTLRLPCCLAAVLVNVLTQLRQKSKELDQDRCLENPLDLICVRHVCSASVSIK